MFVTILNEIWRRPRRWLLRQRQAVTPLTAKCYHGTPAPSLVAGRGFLPGAVPPFKVSEKGPILHDQGCKDAVARCPDRRASAGATGVRSGGSQTATLRCARRHQ